MTSEKNTKNFLKILLTPDPDQYQDLQEPQMSVDGLIRQKNRIIFKYEKYLAFRTALLWASMIIFIVTIFMLIVTSVPQYFLIMYLLTLAVLSLSARLILFPVRTLENKIEDLNNDIELASIDPTEIEKRAERIFKKHQLELQKYYDLTLSHSKLIFFGGIICLFFGWGIVIVTLFFVFNQPPDSTFSEKVIPASLGAIGAILTNYIAVVYLKMYSETINSLTIFHNRLVSSNHLHFSNFLIAKISDPTKRNDALSLVAQEIAKHSDIDSDTPPTNK